ncbi:MAG: outer membrane protein assembly factor BamE [Burkholderiales bacterium]|nr:outer membrane protein assembly factor BamE [Burkholderiales bacterium]
MSVLTRTIAASVLLAVAGCSNVPMLPTLKPYRIDIQQGNYISQDMLVKLKPGMSRSQVRFALGTPLVVDPFRNDRWDYFYMLHKAGALSERRVVTVIFKGDELLRIEGDVVPAASEAKPEPGKVEQK